MSRDRRYDSVGARWHTSAGRILRSLGVGSGVGREGTSALWRELRRRGAERDLVRWARPFGRDLASAWHACPRGSWAIETAARVGVEPTLVTRALEDCVGYAENRDLLVGPSTHEQVERATDAWLQGAVGTRSWVTTVDAFLLEAVESVPDVRRTRRRVEQAHRRKNRADMVAASNDYDEAHLAARRQFASVVLARIPADAIATALHGLKRHPYR